MPDLLKTAKALGLTIRGRSCCAPTRWSNDAVDGPLRHLGAKVLVDRNRREFITLLGGAAAAWPIGAKAQQPDRMRRIGVLMPAGMDDADALDRLSAFQGALEQLGWAEGRNMRMERRWGTSDAATMRE